MLCYHGKDLHLDGHFDADLGGDIVKRFDLWICVLVYDGAISWSNNKQSCIILSTMEVGYMVCSLTLQKAIWLRRFL